MEDKIQRVAISEQVDCFALLPHSLLEKILLFGSSKKDKRALRQTCKLFLQTLDDSLTCINMKYIGAEGVEKLLKRVQHVHSMTKVAIMLDCGMDSLLKHLPGHITTLKILTGAYGSYSIKSLASLPCLASLSIYNMANFNGLEYNSGLSRLAVGKRSVGSLAHLVPTLKNLRVHHIENANDINQLANLKVLECSSMSSENYEQCRQLPLKHVTIRRPGNWSHLFNHAAWQAAPTTLTRLTLGDVYHRYPLHYVSFPSHIKHLQLSLAHAKTLTDIAETISGLTRLDVIWVNYEHHHPNDAFKQLSKLISVQSLGLCVMDVDNAKGYVLWGREKVLSLLHEVANAVQKGVELNVVVDFQILEAMWSQFHDLSSMETSWGSYA